MKEIGTYELKTHLSEIMEKVRLGQTFLITKRGKAVGQLGPIHEGKRSNLRPIIDQIYELRSQVQLGDLSIRDLKNRGRR